ncbi:MAG: tRNA (guanosine(37)-N1)-methyltransferase TrmD [Steroidobacteraceae bacterium]|jgi:tRNA (guanine37-N1)-methyltransferase
MRIEVVTLFPDMIREALRFGVLGRAIGRGIVSVGTEDPRAHTHDVHRTVDDRPYGGGPGMLMKPEPLCAAIEAARARLPAGSLKVAFSAQGEVLATPRLAALSALPGLVLVAGRYEGIDERALETRIDLELSLGDYVLSGGELPALTLIDAIVRRLPGALGDERSSIEESFAEGWLEGPQYTRPEVYEGRAVPAVLLSGDHAAIRRWRLKQALGRTWRRRPQLLAGRALTSEQAQLLEEFISEWHAAHRAPDEQ